MHRSGTSLVARLLNLCGVYLGPEDRLSPARPDNPEGFWENIDFVGVNDGILDQLNGSWDFPPQAEPGWQNKRELDPFKRQAEGFLLEFSDQPLWGWKDPRNSLTLPFWKSVIPQLKIVACLRHPFEVAKSLQARGYSSYRFGYNLWLAYNQGFLKETSPQERVVTHYENLLSDPVAELSRLTAKLGLTTQAEVIQEACKAVSVSLHRSRITEAELLKNNVPADAWELYDKLCREAQFTAPLDSSDNKSRYFSSGFYKDEGGNRWMGPSGRISIPPAQTPAKVSFELRCGKDSYYRQFPLHVFIYQNGEPALNEVFQESNQLRKIEFDVDKSHTPVTIGLACSNYFVPKDLGLREDARKLSLTFSGLSIEPKNKKDLEDKMVFDTTWPAELTELLHDIEVKYSSKDFTAAEELSRQALDLIPDDPQLIVTHGNILLTIGEIEAARREFTKATVLAPDYAPAHSNLAAVLIHQGNNAEAEKSLLKALELCPSDTDVLKVLAHLYFSQQRYWDAIEIYNELLAIDPDSIEVLIASGNCFYGAGDLLSAQQAYERALIFDPNHAVALQNLEFVMKSQAAGKQASSTPVGGVDDKQPRLSFSTGFYQEGPEWFWMGRKGEITIPANPAPIDITFELSCSESEYYNQFPFTVEILSDGQNDSVSRFDAGDQMRLVKLHFEKSERDHIVQLKSSSFFIPALAQKNNDTRELSVYLCHIKVQSSNGRHYAVGSTPKAAAREEKKDNRGVKGCTYCQYDASTLKPLNEQTSSRIKESGLLEFDFIGKSVLDIGCNLGLFSLIAAQRGARKVTGIDVTEEFITASNEALQTFWNNLDEEQHGNIDVSFQRANFSDLDPARFRSDVVLCYEVIHWLTAQGIPLSESIRKLKAITAQDLLLETPWDVGEPSIIQGTKLTKEQYDAETIFRELLKNFGYVRIICFTTYMGDPKAKRVLIHASNSPAQSMSDHGFGAVEEVQPPAWGQKNIHILKESSSGRAYVYKLLSKARQFTGTPPQLVDQLCDALSRYTPSLLAPIPTEAGYLIRYGDETAMLFPWIGPLDSRPAWHLDIHDHLSFLAKLNNELGRIPKSLIAELLHTPFKQSFNDKKYQTKLEACRPLLGQELFDKCQSLLSGKDDWFDEDCYQKLIHGDMNSSNLLRSEDGQLVAVDLDCMQVANDYTDFIYIVATSGVEDHEMAGLVEFYKNQLMNLEGSLNYNTALFGVDAVLTWLAEIIRLSYNLSASARSYQGGYRNTETLKSVFSELSSLNPLLYKAVTQQLPAFCNGLNSLVNHVLSTNKTA
jgi:tetratricopeptide (TPR) repeat protein/SAM-dependent methyltransferase